MPKIYIIHENDEWTEPLIKALKEKDLPYEDWHLDQGILDLTTEPPEGVFYNRMSASSHTRGHRYAPEYTAAVLEWLENHDRTVINSSNALKLEVSKVAQYTALEAAGIRTPKTVAAAGRDNILKAAEKFRGQFITKHNRAGKGLGVKLFNDIDSLANYIDSQEFQQSVDGITLIQEYIDSPDNYITRCEFIGGQFFYAVRVDASQGFELCPADVCQVGDQFCPTNDHKFEIMKDLTDIKAPKNLNNPGNTSGSSSIGQLSKTNNQTDNLDTISALISNYQKFLTENDIQIAGIEFIRDSDGEIYTYDVNTNTNYNPPAEARAGMHGMKKIADYLGSLL